MCYLKLKIMWVIGFNENLKFEHDSEFKFDKLLYSWYFLSYIYDFGGGWGGGALSLTFMLKCVGFAIKPKWNATLDITREWYIQSHIPLSILYYFLELLGGCFDFVYNLFTRK